MDAGLSARLTPSVVAAGCAGYLLLLGWAITNSTYDTWGVLVVIPAAALVGVVAIRKMFAGPLRDVASIIYCGLGLKLAGAALRYWVGFEAYEGAIDAQRYHDYAVVVATNVWDGRVSVWEAFPTGTGTEFTERLAGFIYTLTGASKMAGFVTFSLLGFIGTAFFVKAACIAVPGLARRRYAVLCILAPNLVYWPSSIGKDALMMLFLGVATYGIARFVSTDALVGPFVVVAIGLLGAGFIRPHMVGLWLAGALPALLIAVVRGRDPWETGNARPLKRALLVPVVAIATVTFAVVSTAAIRYLEPDDDAPHASTSDSAITSILDETSRRTVQAGSSFSPPSISNPANWPFASVRTLTRPLLIEARGAGQLLTALEMTVFLGLCATSIRRLMHLPKLVVTNAYVAFAMTTTFFVSLAFTSFANLAVLSRQRSIIFPFMLLIVCLPALPRRPEHDPEDERAAVDAADRPLAELRQNSSMSPRVNAQLANGGSPTSLTARHVRTGPPPGKGTVIDDDDIWA